MFILVNSKPVNILEIEKISGIINITDGEIYERCVKNLECTLKKDDISKCWKTDEKIFGRPEVKVLKFIDDALKAIDIPEGIVCNWDYDDSLFGLKLAEDIPWERVPDGFFFQILFKSKNIEEQLKTSVNSKIYLDEEEAKTAQENLLRTINGAYFDLPKIKI